MEYYRNLSEFYGAEISKSDLMELVAGAAFAVSLHEKDRAAARQILLPLHALLKILQSVDDGAE